MALIEIPTGSVKFRIDPFHTMPATITREGKRLAINFRFNTIIKDEIKAMEGARWHGKDEPNPRKIWSVSDTARNHFQLAYLMDLNPYAPYDAPLVDYKSERTKPAPYSHQIETTSFILTRRHCIIAEEMGVGKTLAAIESMERSLIMMGVKSDQFMWVGPKSALDSVKYEHVKWRSRVVPYFYTYESLKSYVEKKLEIPRVLIFDEASRLKTPTAQRTQAAKAIADEMRERYGRDCFIVLMSGTPAPKDPSDWWSLCEVACPGFLKEGTPVKFKNRLALIKQYESLGGATFPKLVTWWDDESKCKTCGKFEGDPDHDHINMTESWYHPYQKSLNEVQKLYERMKGLVLVKFKADNVDLPDKIFRVVRCKPAPSVLRAARLICKTASSAAKAMILTRELSDGFQYQEVPDGEEKCPQCHGRLKIKMNVDADDPTNPLDGESLTRGQRAIWDEETNQIIGFKEEPLRVVEQEIDCSQCGGTGLVTRYTRIAARVDSPKEAALVDLLDQYEEQGRFVLWAGFTDSVDRCVSACIKQGWEVIRCDGRGWWASPALLSQINAKYGKASGVEMLQAFDDKDSFPKIAFNGHPGAGGMGLNLTASSVNCFYSNTFKLEDRLQAIDRIHRIGADHNRGCMIIDLVHLPQDDLVLQSHARKQDLMLMSMGQLNVALSKIDENYERTV